MNKPKEIGIEVDTPDGKGYIVSMGCRVVVELNEVYAGKRVGRKEIEYDEYSYPYTDVKLLKQQINVNNNKAK